MQIDADRGRGGGVRLDRNWGVGRINLAYSEAVDLLISLAVAEQMNSPMFLANLDSVRRQLVASSSPAIGVDLHALIPHEGKISRDRSLADPELACQIADRAMRVLLQPDGQQFHPPQPACRVRPRHLRNRT